MRLGLLGCGNVGSSLVKLIFENQSSIKEKSGESIELAAIVIRDPKAFRPSWIPKELLTTDAMSVINDPHRLPEASNTIEFLKLRKGVFYVLL